MKFEVWHHILPLHLLGCLLKQEEYSHNLWYYKDYQDEWNLQHFAVFACLAEDRPMTARLFAQIKQQPIAKVWPDPNYFKHCKDWSLQKA